MEPHPPLPIPQPDEAAYRDNLAAALAGSEKCRLNYARLKSQRREERIDALPAKLDFENVSRCNFRCPICPVSQWPQGRRGKDMRFEDFRRILDDLGTLVEIKLQGIGEPTLGGDAFFAMIRYARSQHIWVRTTTNASLLHLDDAAARLVDSGVNEVQVSVDGATRETFEAIRVGSRFTRVCQNIAELNRYCRERGLLRTRMWTVVQQRNAGELLDLVRLGADLGFPRLTFSLDLHGWGQSALGRSNASRLADAEQVRAAAWAAVALGRERGAEVTFWQTTSKFSHSDPAQLCPWPFERAFISSDLRIVPCCMIGNPEIMDLGSALDFTAVWNSEVYRQFRRAHLEGRVPAPCAMCYREGEP
jgi:pyrroloquinoline quinone biosynthesis protein E